ncbi:hypothetical protein DDE05_55130 [Streptomyces cavourensis]|nr:hypothetical protein DDE05_55130 [Streptomyces cavourensis]
MLDRSSMVAGRTARIRSPLLRRHERSLPATMLLMVDWETPAIRAMPHWLMPLPMRMLTWVARTGTGIRLLPPARRTRSRRIPASRLPRTHDAHRQGGRLPFRVPL